MQTCCLVHEEHYFVRNTFFVFLFFFKNKTVSQLFMLAVASKTCCSTLCCQQGLLSTGQAVTGVCVCACVWTLYFSPKKKAWVPTIRGFESESHFDDSFLQSVMTWFDWKRLRRFCTCWPWASVSLWCVSCYLETRARSHLMPRCCVLCFQGKARSERAERKVSRALLLHGDLGLFGGKQWEHEIWSSFFFSSPSQTTLLSFPSESVPLCGSTCF